MEQNGKNFSMVRGDTENLVVDVEVDGIVTKYADKAKVKALTTAERLDRIEEYLGLK